MCNSLVGLLQTFTAKRASGTGEPSVDHLNLGLGEDKFKLASAPRHLDRLTRRTEGGGLCHPPPINTKSNKPGESAYQNNRNLSVDAS